MELPPRDQPRPFLARSALVVLAAALQRLALPPSPLVPFAFVPLALVALTPLFLALRGLGPREALRAGFLYGLVSAALDASWFLNVFPPFLAAGLWLILAVFGGLYAAGHAVLARRPATLAVVGPLLWVAIDWFRSEGWHLRFAWFTLGHALAGDPAFCQDADMAGVYGLTLLGYATSALLARAIDGPGTKAKRVALVLLALALAGAAHARGAHVLASAPPLGANGSLTVVAVQDEHTNKLEPKLSLTTRAIGTGPAPDVILWPEDSFLTDPFQFPVLANAIAATASRARSAFVFGYLHFAGEKSLTGVPLEWNGALVLDPQGKRLGEYHKRQPVQMVEANVKPGKEAPVFPVAGARLGVLICYDGTYPFVARELVQAGATALLLPTMDVAEWGITQHRHHALFYPLRACEVRRPIVRAASSGMSFALDAWGRELASVPVFDPGSFRATIEPRDDRTLYVRGGWLLPFVALAVSVAFFLRELASRLRSRGTPETFAPAQPGR